MSRTRKVCDVLDVLYAKIAASAPASIRNKAKCHPISARQDATISMENGRVMLQNGSVDSVMPIAALDARH